MVSIWNQNQNSWFWIDWNQFILIPNSVKLESESMLSTQEELPVIFSMWYNNIF